jgi:hypothetical protein
MNTSNGLQFSGFFGVKMPDCQGFLSKAEGRTPEVTKQQDPKIVVFRSHFGVSDKQIKLTDYNINLNITH